MSSIDCECRGSGYITVKVNGYDFSRPCICALRLKMAGLVGDRFAGCEISNLAPRAGQEQAVKQLRASPAGSYMFWGGYGTGKTHLMACQFAASFYSDPDHAIWITDTDYAAMSRAVKASPVADILARLRRQPGKYHVFLDDLGKSAITTWVRADLFRMVDCIYLQNHRLSLTSNFSLDALAEDSQEREFQMPGGAIARRIDDIVLKIQL